MLAKKRTPLSNFSISSAFTGRWHVPQHAVRAGSEPQESETADISISDFGNYLSYPFSKHIQFPRKRRCFIQQTRRETTQQVPVSFRLGLLLDSPEVGLTQQDHPFRCSRVCQLDRTPWSCQDYLLPKHWPGTQLPIASQMYFLCF